MSEEVLSQQRAFDLARPGFDLAFVSSQSQLYYSYFPHGVEAPSSALIKLMQGLFDRFVDHSFFILRQRLYTTAPMSPRCWGMLKIIAKRATAETIPRDHGLMLGEERLRIGDDGALSVSRFLSPENTRPLQDILALQTTPLRWVQNIAALNVRGAVWHDYDRDIACVLVDNSGEILGYGLNSNSKNKTLHAEVNLVQRFYREKGRKIPAGAKLYTNRKPCKMCAGLLHDWCEDPATLQIHYAEDDKSSQHTVLDPVAQWFRLDSE